MQDRPSAQELLDAVRLFLATELLPTVSDPRLRFRTLIAANLLDMLRRELALEPDLLAAEYARLATLLGEQRPAPAEPRALAAAVAELQRALCQLIRAGRAPDGSLTAVLAGVRAKLEIANPRYLADFEPI
ncbi:DUF6285 domain-containing protein [Immundisolibacter sp.]|uniref:DUF6285 domain-containing protein n=1 Tax=Immundisolibacter sp. TaxID=1934948 RepID=UPI0026372E30|nr:DUF6285 domain-containing protein [Immundisolibacter sp.]MDD3651356.1 DUF6285 domain-containing protein [Immundisolibacter sp.]